MTAYRVESLKCELCGGFERVWRVTPVGRDNPFYAICEACNEEAAYDAEFERALEVADKEGCPRCRRSTCDVLNNDVDDDWEFVADPENGLRYVCDHCITPSDEIEEWE